MTTASRSSRSILIRSIATASLVALAGCSATTPTPASAPPSATPVAVVETASPTAPATAAPTPTPTARPGPLTVAWTKAGEPATGARGDWESMGQATWTRLGDLYVMSIGRQGDESGPRVWVSDDARGWRPATLPAAAGATVSVDAVTTGGPGLIALGEVTGTGDDTAVETTWVSKDGKAWLGVNDVDLTDGQRWLLRSVARGDVDRDGPLQVSDYPGPPWTGDDPSAIYQSGGSVTAFVGDQAGKPVEVWRSEGGSDWTQVATMPTSNGGIVLRVAHGPVGWFAFGCNADCTGPLAWTSRDGTAWEATSGSPEDEVNAIVGDQSGFIAVGQRITGLGCAVGEGEIFGETWTSSDGTRWRRMPEQPDFKSASIRGLVPVDRTLVGLGLTFHEDGGPDSTAWTADLPDASADEDAAAPSPEPTATPKASGEGCG